MLIMEEKDTSFKLDGVFGYQIVIWERLLGLFCKRYKSLLYEASVLHGDFNLNIKKEVYL